MLKIIRTLAAANVQVAMIYKLNFIFGILSAAIVLFVHYCLWSVIFAGSSSGIVGGYSFSQMVSYIIFTRLLYLFVSSLEIEGSVAGDIISGKLGMYLVKPVNYLLYNVAAKTGDAMLQLGITLMAALVIFNCCAGFSAAPATGTAVVAIIATVLGMLLNMLIGYIFALSAFWLEHVGVMYICKRLLLSFVSGVWIPVSLFPEALQRVLELLPFNYLIYFPAEIFLGKVTGVNLLKGFAVQIVWITGLYLAGGLMWRCGIRKFTSVGG